MSDVGRAFSRRTLLVGTAIAVAGCTTTRHVRANPDAAAVAEARRGELELLAALDPVSPSYAVHVAHLRALGGVAPAPNAPTGSVVALARDSVATLQAAARKARSGATAALLASIAASHASVPELP